MLENFKIAGGTILGRNHKDIAKNNQDFYTWDAKEFYIVGLVCDGCSSGMYSEVGANIGAKLIRKAIERNIAWYSIQGKTADFLELVRHWVLTEIHVQSTLLRPTVDDIVHVIQNYFLFTVIGFIMTEEKTTTFALGDGVIIVNGNNKTIGPFAYNAPPYLTYDLIKKSVRNFNEVDQRFKIIDELPTSEVESILIGSDGIVDLCKASDLKLPGRDDVVGDISNFWTDKSYFDCPDKIRRRLTLMNRDVTKLTEEDGKPQLIKHHGLLPDDTTMIVVTKF